MPVGVATASSGSGCEAIVRVGYGGCSPGFCEAGVVEVGPDKSTAYIIRATAPNMASRVFMVVMAGKEW